MADNQHITEQIQCAFPNLSLYQIFEIVEDATEADIKKVRSWLDFFSQSTHFIVITLGLSEDGIDSPS